MDHPIILHYAGFETKGGVREYAFSLRGRDGECSNYFVTISTEAFAEHRARYQDAPATCSIGLRRELSTQTRHPPSTPLSVSSAELVDYQDAHTPRAKGARSGKTRTFAVLTSSSSR